MSKINDKPNIENISTDLMSNLEKTAGIGIQLVNNQVSSALNNVASTLNVDPNKSPEIIVKQLGDRMSTLNAVLQTPEGKRMLSELGEIGAKMLKTIEEPVKEGQRIFNQMMIEQLRNFEKLAWGALGLVPVVGDVSEIIRIGKDLFQAFIKAMKAFSGISLQTTNALENAREIVNKQANVFTNISKLVQTAVTENINESNNKLKGLLKKASSDLENQTKMIEKETNDISKRVEKEGEIKEFQKGGAKIAKRTKRSIMKFLSPSINASHFKNKYGSKRRTRKKG